MTDKPTGFFGLPDLGDLVGDIVGQVTDVLPDPIGNAIKDTVGKIIDPNDDTYQPGQAQPEGERPIPTTEPKELNAAVKAIDSAVDALELVLKFGFVVPDNIEDILRKLIEGLNTVRGWLD